MSGETWRGTLQIAKETVPGTPVPATRRLYVREPNFVDEPEARFWKFATTTRDNTRGMTLGPAVVSGQFSVPISSDEIIELLLLGVQGSVVPTGTTAKLWTFLSGGVDLDSATFEWHDGAHVHVIDGCRVQQLRIAGSANGENLVTADVYGLAIADGTLTPALAERTPRFFEGWETKLYIDNFGTTPGTTVVPGTLINWDVTIGNNLGRKYTADNVNEQNSMPFGELAVEATLMFEAAPATSLAEYGIFKNATKRVIRLEFGNNEVIAATDHHFVTVDLPGAWSAATLSGEDAGTRTYEFTYGYVYDPALGAGCRVRAQNARATAYAA